MFVRKKRNNSGKVSVQVIDKADGYRVAESMGVSDDPAEIGRLLELGKVFIAEQSRQYSLFPNNLDTLDHEQYPFLVAARLRNESPAAQEEMLRRCHGLSHGQFVVIERENGHRLVVAYSGKRAQKNLFNRERGLFRFRKQAASGHLIKEHLNNRG